MKTFSQNLRGFKDKRVLITGASKGLGWVCSQELARQGARLVCSGRNKEKLDELKASFPKPDHHLVFSGDLVDPKVIRELVSKSEAFFGGIDIYLKK